MSKRMTLRRLDQDEDRTFGQMEDGSGAVIGVTLEHPWRDDNGDGLSDRNVSCIPAGEYPMFLRPSKKHGGTGSRDYDVWELKGVPGRDNVQVHIGNTLKDSLGCILIGTKKAESDHAMVLGSKPAHDRWMDALDGVTTATLAVLDP